VLPRQVWAVDLARGYDANNNLTSRTTAAGTTTYTYDALNRLRSEAGPARTQTFGYDPNGNRTSDGSGTYVPAASSNRYGTIRSSTASYDAAGNLTSLATGSPLTTRTFTYNQAGRLAEVRQGGVLLASYTYNANGQRSRKTLTAQGAQALGLPAVALTIVFHYDTSGNLLAETSSSGTPIRTYVWREAASGPLAETLLDHPVAQIEHANNAALGGSNGTAVEAVLYLRTDELATPREARNAAGTVVWSWTSAAFGDTNPAEDPDGNGQRTIVNLRFPGQYADQEAGLHYNWHRSYDPATGRYLESDPIGLAGGWNTYIYALSNSVRWVDVDGKIAIAIPALPAIGKGFAFVGSAAVTALGLCRLTTDGECEEEIRACMKTCKRAKRDFNQRNVWGGSWWRCLTGCVSFRCQDAIDEDDHAEPET
jgi:RHS repeat-associated protein